MSILIKGMEMPNRCPCKLVGVGYDMYCAFVSGIPSRVQEYYECCEKGTRPDWCPLVPVPPHGDLIDFDFCINNYELLHDDDGNPVYAVRMRAIALAPTVIPAEPHKEENQ